MKNDSLAIEPLATKGGKVSKRKSRTVKANEAEIDLQKLDTQQAVGKVGRVEAQAQELIQVHEEYRSEQELRIATHLMNRDEQVVFNALAIYAESSMEGGTELGSFFRSLFPVADANFAKSTGPEGGAESDLSDRPVAGSDAWDGGSDTPASA